MEVGINIESDLLLWVIRPLFTCTGFDYFSQFIDYIVKEKGPEVSFLSHIYILYSSQVQSKSIVLFFFRQLLSVANLALNLISGQDKNNLPDKSKIVSNSKLNILEDV